MINGFKYGTQTTLHPASFGYYAYEAAHAMLGPARAMSEAASAFLASQSNPWSHLPAAKHARAAFDMFERATRRYGKPKFDLPRTVVRDEVVAVNERVVWSDTFCRLIHFDRSISKTHQSDPKMLIVAPMSGHYATLLRGTVEAFLPSHEVFITDWEDARLVPMTSGKFDLDDYIRYVIDMIRHIGPDVHVLAVCQPAVPVIAAVALMESRRDPLAPISMTLMGGPIDTRRSPTAVNLLAESRGTEWFQRNCILAVPFNYPGYMRPVYPGFFQLSGFMAMNLDRHINAHREYFDHLVQGDGDNAEKHREFYDEYLAVMDLTAEFYLQTVDTVFVRQALPKGEMRHGDEKVDLAAIERVALMTVEGENDDISGVGQTQAAHDLCMRIPADRRRHHLALKVGHYGVFNGSRFRREIAPAIASFIRAMQPGLDGRNGAGRASESAAALPAPAPKRKAAKRPPAR
jgi:poly(3-hydroxybutyrate) depolymerase